VYALTNYMLKLHYIVTHVDRPVAVLVFGSEPLVVYCQKCGVEVDTLAKRRHKCRSNCKTESESETQLEQTALFIERDAPRYWLSFLIDGPEG
jgi:hypothetical protein